MAVKTSKNKKQNKAAEAKPANQNRAAKIMFAIFAFLLILSMVLSAIATY